MKKGLFLVLYFTTLSCITAQKDNAPFSVRIGKFRCKPEYRINFPDSSNITEYQYYTVWDKETKTYEEKEIPPYENGSVLVRISEENEMNFYFPAYMDSSSFENVNGTWVCRPRKISNITFVNVHDSILPDQIDSLLNSVVSIVHRNLPQKVLSFQIGWTYKDGRRYGETITSDRIMQSKKVRQELRKNKEIAFIEISGLSFKDQNRIRLHITEGFTWKVIR